ncbi:hypothetical protein H0H92_006276 [Tricholoma furcatifolium]|nr:hypothetical protein H0H92_006276 [Tricholoma furcatifolium]
MSTSGQTPNAVVIDLPPGFTLEELYALQFDIVTVAITGAITFAIVVWDYFYLLPDEYRYYHTAKKSDWKTLAPYSDHCQVGLTISQLAAVIVIATSGIAFGYRVMSVWGADQKAVAGSIAALGIVMVGAWVAVISQLRATNGSATFFGSNCQVTPFMTWTPLGYALSFVFNITVLTLMLAKISQQRDQQSNFLRIAYNDSLTLMSIATGASLTVLIIQCLGPDYQLVKQIAQPFFTLITATMGARIFLILRITSPMESGRHAAIPNYTFTNVVSQRIDRDKVAYIAGDSSPPAPPPKDFISDTKISPSPYTTFPSPRSHKPRQTPSPSSDPSLLQSQLSTQGLTPAVAKESSETGGFAIRQEIHHNPYTTFPGPPSPPQVTLDRVRNPSVDSSTPLVKNKFAIPVVGGKKSKKDDYIKSEWQD